MAKQAEAEAVGIPAEAPKKKTSRKKLLLLLAIALLLIGGAGTAIVSLTGESSDGDEAARTAAEAARKAAAPVYLPLEAFVVNLRDEDGDHYLRVGVVLEGSDQEAIDAAKIQLPRIRNSILLLLSAKSTEEISTMAGKQQLVQEIIAEARKPMPIDTPTKGIESVYFSDFVIQ